jgi:hypothetical protein
VKTVENALFDSGLGQYSAVVVWGPGFVGVVVGGCSVDLPGGFWNASVHPGIGREILFDIRLPRILVGGSGGGVAGVGGVCASRAFAKPVGGSLSSWRFGRGGVGVCTWPFAGGGPTACGHGGGIFGVGGGVGSFAGRRGAERNTDGVGGGGLARVHVFHPDVSFCPRRGGKKGRGFFFGCWAVWSLLPTGGFPLLSLAALVLGGLIAVRAGLKFIVVGGRNRGGAWDYPRASFVGRRSSCARGPRVGGDVEWRHSLCGVGGSPCGAASGGI